MRRNRCLFPFIAVFLPLPLRWASLPVLALGLFLLCTLPARAVVVISDGFGDGDLDNNGVAFEPIDTDVSLNGVADSYIALDNDGTPMLFPMDTPVTEATVADNTGDTGIRWFSAGGWTTPNATTGESDGTASIHMIDDSTGSLPETNAGIGFYNVIAGATQVSAAIDNGLALGVEIKGRTRGFTGFFETDQDYSNGKQGTIELGPQVDDEVKVSFDFRVWMSAPNFNGNANNHIPQFGELRFGVFQDTDDELGQTNSFAGQPDPFSGIPGPVVWGEEGGTFRGDASLDGPDATGDAGWYVRLPLKDPNSGAGIPAPDGRDARINEETNDPLIYGTAEQFLGGNDNDTVAIPDIVDPDFLNLELTKVYQVELSLKRFDETTGGTTGDPGDNILATVTVEDIAAAQTYSLSGFDPLGVPGTNDPDGGFESEYWDYFAMQVAGQSSSDDFDFLIDNFVVEVIGSNAPDADVDGDGDVDGEDFLIIQRTDPSLIPVWQSQFGSVTSLAAVVSVPEPTGVLLLLLGLVNLRLATNAVRQRRMR